MPNYKLQIAYDGTLYNGWQIQPEGDTVQGKIKTAIEKILRQKVTLNGAGRTDSGVHAFGQIANFNSDEHIDAFRFVYSLNSMLPYDIAIKNMEEVPDDFDARHSALKRTYLYFISKKKDPFFYKYSYYLYSPPTALSLNEFAPLLLQTVDFASFSKNISEQSHTLCNLYSIHWKEQKDFLIFRIEGNRFLHGMVRTLVGTMLLLAPMENRLTRMEEIINSGDRSLAGEAVPSKGLFLRSVSYEN